MVDTQSEADTSSTSIVDEIAEESDTSEERIDALETTVELLVDRVGDLEDKHEKLRAQFDESHLSHEKKISKANKRITKLEEGVTGGRPLTLDLSELEEYLTGVEELLPNTPANTKRAVGLMKNWDKFAISTDSGTVANIKTHNVAGWLEEIMKEEEGEDVTFSPKQVHRVLDKVANMSDHDGIYTEIASGNGSKRLVVEHEAKRDLLWSEADLEDALKYSDDPDE